MFHIKTFIFCLLLFFSINVIAEEDITIFKNKKIENTIIWGEYTRDNMFEKGNVYWKWIVAVIPPKTSPDELNQIARLLVKHYPDTRIRIFDDSSQIKQFIQRDIFINDKSKKVKEVTYPAEWARMHHIGNINDRSDIQSFRWQLVDRFGKHISFLE